MKHRIQVSEVEVLTMTAWAHLTAVACEPEIGPWDLGRFSL